MDHHFSEEQEPTGDVIPLTTGQASPLTDSEENGFSRVRRDWIEPILIAFILAALIRTFIFQPFKIPSGSMEDTLLVGDQLIALKFVYGLQLPFSDRPLLKLREPKPGDVVVFRFPQDPSKDFIKRCVAVGGQTVRIENKQLFVNGVLQQLPDYAKFVDTAILPPQFGPRDNFGPVTVPAGQLFMLGDNRDNSNDSRFWDFVPVENIKGKAVLIYWSWNQDASPRNPFHKVRWRRFLHPIK